jgi:hypothetical protein
MFRSSALPAALGGEHTHGLARHGAFGVGGAFDAALIGAARRPLRIWAIHRGQALDAQPGLRLTERTRRVAVARPRAGHAAAPARDVTASTGTLLVATAFDAALLASITHAHAAAAVVQAFDAAPRREIALGLGFGAMRRSGAFHTTPASIAGGSARLAAIHVRLALHAQAERKVAQHRGLARAITRLQAALRAAAGGHVAVLPGFALLRRAALDARAADALGFGCAAVGVARTFHTRSARAERALARAVAGRAALARSLDER